MEIAGRTEDQLSFSATLKTGSRKDLSLTGGFGPWSAHRPHTGVLIVNADDWGRDAHTTGRILDCALRGTISSVSAMVFMEDSERAAANAREREIDTGLHLNLTTPFSANACPPRLKERQRELSNYLRGHRFARAVYHPWLRHSFEYVVKAQIEEYSRIYGTEPERFDGHHHMHLCANVLFGGLLRAGTIVRRHFSWESGEKRLRNGLFRKVTDVLLARRYGLVDFLFALPPFEPPARLQRILSLASQFVVELETHPVNPAEYRFLTDGEIFRWAAHLPIVPRFAVASLQRASNRKKSHGNTAR